MKRRLESSETSNPENKLSFSESNNMTKKDFKNYYLQKTFREFYEELKWLTLKPETIGVRYYAIRELCNHFDISPGLLKRVSFEKIKQSSFSEIRLIDLAREENLCLPSELDLKKKSSKATLIEEAFNNLTLIDFQETLSDLSKKVQSQEFFLPLVRKFAKN